MKAYREKGVVFDCGNNRLVGIAAIPEITAEVGVLILVGGPQYRVGSHRLFTCLARSLAEAGIASMRFDYTGMGDSEGERREFEEIEEDILAATEAFFKTTPEISRIVLWGLCDAASSAMMFAHRYPKVTGMILLNPWVHSGEYSPEVKMAQYYRPLLSNTGKWRLLSSRKAKVIPALGELARNTLALVQKRSFGSNSTHSKPSFVCNMLDGLQRFQHGILIVLSEDDLTAREFSSMVIHDKDWKEATSKHDIILKKILAADHTLSKKTCMEEVSQMTVEWVRQQ